MSKIICHVRGPIGSGKSSVCSYLSSTYPIYHMDKRAKDLAVENQALKVEIIKYVGESAYACDGSYNIPYVRAKIFENSSIAAAFGALFDTYLRQDFASWVSKQNKPIIFLESATVIDRRSYGITKVIHVTAPEWERVERVMRRSGLTAEMTKKMIDAQPLSDIRDGADYVLENSGTPEDLFAKIERVLVELSTLR